MNNIIGWACVGISSGCFTGFVGKIFGQSGKGGGLAGSFLAFLIQIFLAYENAPWQVNYLLMVFSVMLGFIIVKPAENFLLKKGERRRHTGELVDHDFNETNIDEIGGQFAAGCVVFGLNMSFNEKLFLLIISFIAFRYFDVKKIFGIKQLEKLLSKTSTSLAIMLDDLLAGIYASTIVLIASIIMIVISRVA